MTLRCLESLEAQDYPPYAVVLVDNGSWDGSPEIIKRWLLSREGSPGDRRIRVEVLYSPENLGFAGGNNLAIRHVLSWDPPPSHLLFLNNDARLHPMGLRTLVEVAEASGAGIVGATILSGEGEVRDLPLTKAFKEKLWVEGACILVAREVLEGVHALTGRFFDEDLFLYGEEIELCFQARRLGFGVIQALGALAFHEGAQSSGGKGSPVSCYYKARNRVLVFGRMLRQPLRFLFHLGNFFLSLGHCCFYLLAGSPRSSWATITGLLDAYRGKKGKWEFHDREVLRLRASHRSRPAP